MATMILSKTERVIGLWLDAIGGDEPKWVVSRDRMAPTGEAETSTTVGLFDEGDYDAARSWAVELARKDGVKVVQTETDGTQTIAFDPETEDRT